ncbi:hypothetical protein CYMTET_19222 [Cymbomonas tetramitiformis]|uniref:PIN-like protein n=1 Tax=Cymbomonas tetramitiformis TaxID=36881 RepID=A0AAE0L5E5_9CHLO|nr:hypothetical protein CYMTET_19222 [Cymbomonas tetramitiformis]
MWSAASHATAHSAILGVRGAVLKLWAVQGGQASVPFSISLVRLFGLPCLLAGDLADQALHSKLGLSSFYLTFLTYMVLPVVIAAPLVVSMFGLHKQAASQARLATSWVAMRKPKLVAQQMQEQTRMPEMAGLQTCTINTLYVDTSLQTTEAEGAPHSSEDVTAPEALDLTAAPHSSENVAAPEALDLTAAPTFVGGAWQLLRHLI